MTRRIPDMKQYIVRNKNGIDEVRFFIGKSGEAFPTDQFNLAVSWMMSGQLNAGAVEFVQKIKNNEVKS